MYCLKLAQSIAKEKFMKLRHVCHVSWEHTCCHRDVRRIFASVAENLPEIRLDQELALFRGKVRKVNILSSLQVSINWLAGRVYTAKQKNKYQEVMDEHSGLFAVRSSRPEKLFSVRKVSGRTCVISLTFNQIDRFRRTTISIEKEYTFERCQPTPTTIWPHLLQSQLNRTEAQ